MPLVKISDINQIFPELATIEVTLHDLGWTWGDSGTAATVELLCKLALSGRVPVVEIGTFRGRTTYNLAANSDGPIYTIDLGEPPAGESQENIERMAYPQYTPGELFTSAPDSIRRKIHQILGDSRTLDLSHLSGRARLVYVDGGHSYEVCRADSAMAQTLLAPGGAIVWDDYGEYWPGVRRAIDELARELSLHYLPAQGLVIWSKP